MSRGSPSGHCSSISGRRSYRLLCAVQRFVPYLPKRPPSSLRSSSVAASISRASAASAFSNASPHSSSLVPPVLLEELDRASRMRVSPVRDGHALEERPVQHRGLRAKAARHEAQHPAVGLRGPRPLREHDGVHRVWVDRSSGPGVQRVLAEGGKRSHASTWRRRSRGSAPRCRHRSCAGRAAGRRRRRSRRHRARRGVCRRRGRDDRLVEVAAGLMEVAAPLAAGGSVEQLHEPCQLRWG